MAGLEGIEGLARLNIFVGPNNSGKSRLLRMLASTRQISSISPQTDLEEQLNSLIREAVQSMTSYFPIETETRVKELRDVLSSNGSWSKQRRDYFLGVFNGLAALGVRDLNIRLLGSGTEDRLLNTLHRVAKDGIDVIKAFEKDHAWPEDCPAVYIPVLRGLRDLRGEVTGGTLLQTDDVYASRTRRDYYATDSPKGKRPRIFSGLEMYRGALEHRLGLRSKRLLLERYEAFLSEKFFEGTAFELRPLTDGSLNFRVGEEQERPIAHLGDGLQSIVTMTFLAECPDDGDDNDVVVPKRFFIEEPELFLHPGMQRKLIEYFSSHKHHHFFVTTHSNHFLDMTMDYQNISVFRVQKKPKTAHQKEDYEPTFKVTRVNRGDRSVLEDLGVRNSSVFLVNATVWVEGITDRLYLRKMFELYQENEGGPKVEEDVHYSFVEYGGANITHWSFLGVDAQPNNEKRIDVDLLCGEAIVVTDRDGEEKNASRKEVLSKRLGKRYICLPVREIENMLPPRVIWSVVKSYEKDAVRLPDEPPFNASAYARKPLGRFIENVLEEKWGGRTRTGTYAEGSGTVTDKIGFCRQALASNGWECSRHISAVVGRIIRLIRHQNDLDNRTPAPEKRDVES